MHRHTFRSVLTAILVLHMVSAATVLADQFNLGDNITRDAGPVRSDIASGTLKQFSEAYKANSKPKVAIFLNRTLSDDVREWRTDARAVISGNGSVTMSSETPLHYREETVKGPVAASVQEYNGSSGERNTADEPSMWAFEDGFMQMFLRAGVTLIDRGTVMRLLSRKSSQGIGNEAIEVKKTEMDALVNNADVYIELLITRYPSAPTGYEFRAVAKEVRTGRILASVTSLNWDNEKYRPKKVITTDKGYKIVKDKKMPRLQDMSRDLAVDLMNAMLLSWNAH